MPTLNETKHTGGYILSEANGNRSRENATLNTGENLQAGTVLGMIALGVAAAAATAGNAGDGAMGAITVGADAQVGDYVLTITKAATNAGEFQVVDPQGDVVGLGNVAEAFSGGGLSFTLADGATDFVKGDSITITVAEGTGKYVGLTPANTDGSQIATAILYAGTDATAADVECVITARDTTVNQNELIWPVGITADEKAAAITQLNARGIVLR